MSLREALIEPILETTTLTRVMAEDSQAPITSFRLAPERQVAVSAKLKQARVEVKIDRQVVRVSPSICNNLAAIDKHPDVVAEHAEQNDSTRIGFLRSGP